MADSVGTLSTRSAPPTSITSETPLAISITAWRKATWLVAQAFSKRVVGTVGSPSRVAARGPMWSWRSVSPPVTLPKYSAWMARGAIPASVMASAAAAANSSALRAIVLAELGDTDSDHGDATHEVS